jgi:hypothetical protein
VYLVVLFDAMKIGADLPSRCGLVQSNRNSRLIHGRQWIPFEFQWVVILVKDVALHVVDELSSGGDASSLS